MNKKNKILLPLQCLTGFAGNSPFDLDGVIVDTAKYHYLSWGKLDLHDYQNNTYQGTHSASQGGTWQTAVFGFGGLRVKEDKLHLHPWLPKKWNVLRYKVIWRNRLISVNITSDTVHLYIESERELINGFDDEIHPKENESNL